MAENSPNQSRIDEEQLKRLAGLIDAQQTYQQEKETIESRYRGMYIAISNGEIIGASKFEEDLHIEREAPVYILGVPTNPNIFRNLIYMEAGAQIPYPKTRQQLSEN